MLEPLVTLLTDAGTPLTELADALARLQAAGARVTVRMQRADVALLDTLAAGGAEAIEWTVRAPTTAAAEAWTGGTAEADGLHETIRAAGERGLEVRLRWRVAARTVTALTDLRELAELGARVTVVALPWLDGEEVPALDAVAAAWPHELPGALQLLRSDLWPACVGGQAGEAAAGSERAQAAPRHVAACDNCPMRAQSGHGCPGVAAALLGRPGGVGSAWLAWQRPRRLQVQETAVHIDSNCVEARGLALGLRRAWRLMLPEADVAPYREAFAAHGWHVGAVANVDAGAGGLIRHDEASGHVLTVVAVTAEDAAAAMDAERANLHRPAPTSGEPGAQLAAIAASHRRLGALYGYPTCCVEAFLDAHAEVIEHVRETDNAIAILRATLRTRHFDVRLASLPGLLGEEAHSPLRHLPCRFDCPASQALAATLLADLAVHNPAWTAQREIQAAQPLVLFADGTCLALHGTATGADEVSAVTGMTVRLSQVVTPAMAERFAALAALADLTSLRVLPGRGLALQRDGQWQDWPTPTMSEPRAAEFPILLPFGAERT